MSNIVVDILNKVADARKTDSIEGTVKVMDGKCEVNEQRDGVYGFAIKIDNVNDIEPLIKEMSNDKSLQRIDDEKKWTPLDPEGKWYPLYWGKDSYLGSRLSAHTDNKQTKTYTIRLWEKSYLQNYEIVFGGIFCKNKEDVEEELHNRYPDPLLNKSDYKAEKKKTTALTASNTTGQEIEL